MPTPTQNLKKYATNPGLLADKPGNLALLIDELQAGNIHRTATATAYTAKVTDGYVGVTSTAAARTITLPKAADAGEGKVLIVKDESGAANTNNITVDGDGSETIDGATTKVINTAYGVVRLICTGTAWFTF